MPDNDHLSATLTPVVALLESMDVLYYVGGSVAAMVHGERRETADVDIVADFQRQHVERFVQELSERYYVDASMIIDAIENNSSFNIINLESMFKVDVFPLKNRSYDKEAALRRLRQVIEGDPSIEAYVASPEDIVLAKLEWYRETGETSDRQWRDILGVLKMQIFTLDLAYITNWAREIKVDDLLARALEDAGYEGKSA